MDKATVGSVVEPRRICEDPSVMWFHAARSPRAPFLLLAGVVALVALACGSDESPDQPVPATETAREVAPEATTETQPADAGSSVDEHYLRDVCAVGRPLEFAFQEAARELEFGEDLDEDDPAVFATRFIDGLREHVAALQMVTPPDDVGEYHKAAIAQYDALIGVFDTMLEAAESGEESAGEEAFEGFGAIFAGGFEALTLPPDVRDRLAEAASTVPECFGSGFLLGFLGGGEGAPAGSDDPAAEAYVREVCLVGAAYEAAVQEATAGLDPDADLDESDPEVFGATFAAALRGLAADMRAISPPAGTAAYHGAFTSRFEEMVALLDGIMETFDAGDDVAAEDSDRFQEILQGGGRDAWSSHCRGQPPGRGRQHRPRMLRLRLPARLPRRGRLARQALLADGAGGVGPGGPAAAGAPPGRVGRTVCAGRPRHRLRPAPRDTCRRR